MNLDAAIDFVRKNGNMFERARLQHTLGEDFDAQEVLNGFSAVQNPDGGFPYCDRKGFPSCLSNTTMAVSTLAGMGLGDSEPAKLGIAHLINTRGKNDAWEENPKIKPLDPPFWDMPGDRDTALWLTAAAADILLRTGNEVSVETLDYLRGHQSPEGRFEGFEPTTWIALSVFGVNGKRDDAVFSRALGHLESADIEDWDAGCIAWCLESMKHGGVRDRSMLWNRLFDRLSETQEPDGCWPSDGGAPVKARDANSVLAAVMDIIEK